MDERVRKVLDILPRFNCGSCGCGSCEALARRVAADPSEIERCVNLEPSAKADYIRSAKG